MSVVGDIKTAVAGISGAPLGGSGAVRLWRREEVPEDAAFPYLSVFDVTSSPALSGDGAAMAWGDLVQVDLWQESPLPEGASVNLHEELADALDGIRADGRRLTVRSVDRITESSGGANQDEAEAIHHAITLARARLR